MSLVLIYSLHIIYSVLAVRPTYSVLFCGMAGLHYFFVTPQP